MNYIRITLFFVCNIVFAQNNFESGYINSFERKISSPEKYFFKEINFKVTKNITLGGTLITPKTKYSKIVIIAPGAGKDTRHSHYILAERLLENGIAVYRYDDRGVRKNGGWFNNASMYHDIQNLKCAFNSIRKIDSLSEKTIGIFGHSKGGYIASVINHYKNFDIDFLVIVGTSIYWKGKWKKHKFKERKTRLSLETIYKNIDIPTLFVGGKKDKVDIISSSKLLTKLNNKNIEIKILDGLDHYLRISDDEWRNSKDYSKLYHMNYKASKLITNWIKATSNTLSK